jgi:hypothetical protein
MDMSWAPGIVVVAPRVCTRFDGHKLVSAVGIGQGAPGPTEVWVHRCRMLVHLVAITSGSVGLPDFYQGVGNRVSPIVQHVAGQHDALSQGLARVLPSEIAVRFSDIVMPIHRTSNLGKSVRQNNQRLAWCSPNRCAIRRMQRCGLAVRIMPPVHSNSSHFVWHGVLTHTLRFGNEGKVIPKGFAGILRSLRPSAKVAKTTEFHKARPE